LLAGGATAKNALELLDAFGIEYHFCSLIDHPEHHIQTSRIIDEVDARVLDERRLSIFVDCKSLPTYRPVAAIELGFVEQEIRLSHVFMSR